MDISPDFVMKQEENIEDNSSYLDLGLDIKIEVEDASSELGEETDWCVDNKDLFNNNSYVNVYDDYIECIKQECLICHKNFEDLSTLYQHNLTHMKVKLGGCSNHPHQCKQCNVYFQTEDKLKAHKQLCNPSSNAKLLRKGYQCNECGKVLTYKSWYSHIRNVHNLDKAVCKICNKEYKCHKYLRTHMMYKHEGFKPGWKVISDVKCQLCPTILRNKYSLKTHMNNCHSDSEFKCEMCEAIFKSKPYLRTHIDRVHDGDGKKYLCVCGKSFGSPRRLRRHKQRSGCEDIRDLSLL